jgi:hypothetical protein
MQKNNILLSLAFDSELENIFSKYGILLYITEECMPIVIQGKLRKQR